MRFEFLDQASEEFKEAFDWYARRSLKAAEGFREAVRMAVVEGMQNPTSAGLLMGKRSRKIPLKPYRYGLIYFVHGNYFYIVAIAPNRRPPSYWKSRLRNA
jgi:plasmid stabilization system protein ParE